MFQIKSSIVKRWYQKEITFLIFAFKISFWSQKWTSQKWCLEVHRTISQEFKVKKRIPILKSMSNRQFRLKKLFFGTKITKKVMYQEPMKGVIGSHFAFNELYGWPNHSSNISIKKSIGNDMESLKVGSKWANLHVLCHFCS